MFEVNLLIFIFKVIAYSLPIPLMSWTYHKYGHWSHLGLAMANLLFLSSTILAFIIEGLADFQLIEIGWMFANIFLYCAFWIIILSLLIAQFDKLPTFSHLITLIAGILIGLILNPENVNIYYESGQISASYSIYISLCGGLILIVFIITALNPLIKKIISNNIKIKKKQYFIIFIAYTICVFWVIALFLTEIEIIRLMRRFILAIGMFLWSVGLYIDPLTIVISKAKIQKAIILTKNGLPVFSYDFELGEEMSSSSDLLAGILSAIKSGIEQLVSSGKSLKTMAFEDAIMNFVNGEEIVLLLLSQQTISSNTELIANIFIEKFETKFMNLLKENVIDKEKMSEVTELFQDIMDNIQI